MRPANRAQALFPDSAKPSGRGTDGRTGRPKAGQIGRFQVSTPAPVALTDRDYTVKRSSAASRIAPSGRSRSMAPEGARFSSRIERDQKASPPMVSW